MKVDTHPGLAASSRPAIPEPTHCPYCALQCGVHLSEVAGKIHVQPRDFPVNQGALCIKGWTAGETLTRPDRLVEPLARTADGRLAPVSWDEALGRVAGAIRRTQSRHGADAVGVLGGGALTNEKAYLLGKFARVGLGTANIDYNGRFCMSSAAAASIRAFGIDRGLPFPVEDIARAGVVLLVGSNIAETMPPLMRYFDAMRAGGGRLIVVDPRRTATAAAADLHLENVPGSDGAVANGLLHLLIRNRTIDLEFIRERTEGFNDVRAAVAAYWPERVEGLTGVPEVHLLAAARLMGDAASVMVLTGRGAEQQSHGVENTLAFINIALALGQVGKPFGGYGCLTGQGNGQGGREHGQKADQLPGYRSINDPRAREHMARVWDVPESALPGPGLSAYEMLAGLGQPGGVRTLLVAGTNPAVSAPDGRLVRKRIRALDFLAVADFFLSETAQLADVVLPTAQWAEEDGTMTNLEGRVIRRRRAVAPPPGVRSDLEWLTDLAGRLGRERHFRFVDARSVFDELRRASAGGVADYSGMTYEKIESGNGVFWPCPWENHPGTPRLFGPVDPDDPDGLPPPGFFTRSGKARFHAVRHGAPAENPDREYPLYFTTGRVLAQYQSGVQTRRVARLSLMAGEALLEIHPSQAARYGVVEGGRVVVRTRRGAAVFRARLTRGIREDTLFAPFHWPGKESANRLTHPALDPVSRMPEFKVCAARIERAPLAGCGKTEFSRIPPGGA